MATRTSSSSMCFAALVALVAVFAATIAACGGSGTPSATAQDASAPDAALPSGDAAPLGDASPLDAAASHDAGAQPACPPGDAGTAPAAPALSLIVADPNAYPEGITTDNQVVYSSNGAFSVVPLDGSAQPQALVPAVDGGTAYAIASGASVFIGGSDTPTLSVWSTGHAMRLLTTSSVYEVAAGSNDGAWIAYAVVDSNGTAHLVVEAADGSRSTTVASGLLVDSCRIVMQFADDTLVAQYCDASTAGISTYAALAAFAAPSFAPTILAGEVQLSTGGGPMAYSEGTVDPTGTRVWAPLASAPKNGELITLASPGTPAVVDTAVGMGVFSPLGDTLFYATTGGALKRVATSAPSSPVAVADTAASVLDVSPDGKYAAYSTVVSSSSTRYYDDLYLASAAAPGAPVTEDGTIEVVVNDRMFTIDSQFLFYRVNTGTNSVLYFAPVSCGAPALLSENAAYYAHPMTGSIVLVADAFSYASTGPTEINDLSLYDLRAPTMKTSIAVRVATSVLLPPDGKTIVYLSQTQVAPGVGPGLIRATLQ